MSNLISFLKSRSFVINLVILLVIILIIFGSVSSWMSRFTHHGESISVPDLRGQKIERMESFLADKHLQYKVIDSLFDLQKNPGTILEQDPAPNSKVKEGRTIYLTVNAQHAPDVKMPNLISRDAVQCTELTLLEQKINGGAEISITGKGRR